MNSLKAINSKRVLQSSHTCTSADLTRDFQIKFRGKLINKQFSMNIFSELTIRGEFNQLKDQVEETLL